MNINTMISLKLLFPFFLLFSLNGKGQIKKYFEGKIIYTPELISNNEKVDTGYLKKLFGNSVTLYFKEGNYCHIFDGGMFEFDIYRKKDNKFYIKQRGNDTIFWKNCGTPGDKIEKFTFSKNKEKILGINCDELIIQYKDRSESHYYNSDSILTNPKWFKAFTLNGENLIDEKEKSIYLKNKIDYGYFQIIQTAINISREKIPAAVFDIPANSILHEQK